MLASPPTFCLPELMMPVHASVRAADCIPPSESREEGGLATHHGAGEDLEALSFSF